MDVVENLEIYIPAEAEVKIVPLRSLPPSVLRRMDLPPSTSRQPADSQEVVWISPIVLRGRGQKPPEEAEESKSQMYRLSRASSCPLRMSFVSASRAAYSVLKNGTPPRKRASSMQAAPSSHRDAVVVYRRRIYLSIRKQGHRQGQPPPDDMLAVPSTSYGPASGQKRPSHSASLRPRAKRTKNHLTEPDHITTHQELLTGNSLRTNHRSRKATNCENREERNAAPAQTSRSVTEPPDAALAARQDDAGGRQAVEKAPDLEPTRRAAETKELSGGDADIPELSLEEDGEGKTSYGDSHGAADHGGGQSRSRAESPGEGPSCVSQQKPQVDFQALAQEEKIAKMKMKLQQREAALKNLQAP